MNKQNARETDEYLKYRRQPVEIFGGMKKHFDFREEIR
jgi:hypothetical protein